jgi:predicted dehydrogenase
MTRTRIALVSATGTGRKRMLPALRDSKVGIVTAVHGRDPDKVRQLARDFGRADHYTDLDRMMADAEFDIAVVCSPPFLHVEQLQSLIGAGIPTLCEKPLAIAEKDAQAIRETADRSRVLVMVAHQLRHQNTYAEIKATIASGEIGEVKSAFMEWSFAMNRNAPNRCWKEDPALNGPSALSDAGVHCLDLAIGLFGPGTVVGASSPSRGTRGVIEACDILHLHGSVQVSTRVSRLYGPYSNQLLISGTRGEIAAPLFFTEMSAPHVKVIGDRGQRVIERLAGNAYRQEVEDFVLAARSPDLVSAGTSVDEAIVACRMMDEAHGLLERS